MKKLAVSVVVLLLCLICACACADKEGMYTYQLNEDNTVTITEFDWASNHGDIYIPEMLGNRMVSAIGDKAFATTGNTAVKITLPDNIRSIGAEAFRGASITYVNIPLNTTEIGGGAFAECSVMRFNVADNHPVFATIDNVLYNKQTKTLIAWPTNKEIAEIPKGIKNIGDYAFYGRSFSSLYKKESYSLPSSVDTIGAHAFENVTGLSLNASGVIIIGNDAFRGADVEINSSSISVIGDYAFYGADVTFTSTLSLTKIGKYAFAQGKANFKQSERGMNLLSATPYEIDEYAFYNNQGKSDLVLTNVTSIGAHAFERDIVTIYNSYNWSFNPRIEEDDLKDLTYLGEKAFNWAAISTWGNKDKGYHAYAYLTNDSLKAIPDEAFAHTVITDVKIGPSVTEIGKGAFCGSDVNQVELSEGLLTIGDEAFKDCGELTRISIPASVTMMGNDIFSGCADTFVVTVEAGSYGEVWARTCGYAYEINGKVEDTSWLD